MLPAARLTDRTMHGGIIIMGKLNVWITRRPASRVGDFHLCPPGHYTGAILPPCAVNVLIGNKPAARITDKLACGCGVPDVIATGERTVLIGTNSRTFTVEVHGGITYLHYGNFFIRDDPNDPAFMAQALAALVRLDGTPTMKRAFDALDASGHAITVVKYNPGPGDDPDNAYCTPVNLNDALPAGTNMSRTYTDSSGNLQTANYAGTGNGTNSVVTWSPSVNGYGTAENAQPGSDVILAHETIHGTHNATGTHGDGPSVLNSDGTSGAMTGEERNTVGLPASTYNNPYNAADPTNGTALPDTRGAPYTENQVREDYRNMGNPSPASGNPPVSRPSYYPSPTTPGNPPGSPF